MVVSHSIYQLVFKRDWPGHLFGAEPTGLQHAFVRGWDGLWLDHLLAISLEAFEVQKLETVAAVVPRLCLQLLALPYPELAWVLDTADC